MIAGRGRHAAGMRKSAFLLLIIFIVGIFTGCGYTTGSLISDRFRTIYIQPFKNKVAYATEQRRNLYLPLLEVDVHNAVVDRYLFDGNLRVVDEDVADLILKGELIGYERDVLRYTDNDDVEEYRIRIIVSLVLWDVAQEQPMWSEPYFAGEATYFTTGQYATSESAAVDDALTDLARRIVERTIEDW